MFFKVINLAYKGLLKNNENNQLYILMEKELDYYRDITGLSQSTKQVFPSGGVKLIKNYTRYQDATQFTTKMKHISKFYLDLNALDNDGTLRKFSDALTSLDNEIKSEIKNRVINLKENKRNKQGTINSDLASIQPQEFKNYYLELISENQEIENTRDSTHVNKTDD